MADVRAVTVLTFEAAEQETMSHVLDLMQWHNEHGGWPVLSGVVEITSPPAPQKATITGLANLRTEPTAKGLKSTILAALNASSPPIEVIGEAGDYYQIRAYVWKARLTTYDDNDG